MPNTFLMHEFIRMAAENCFDDEENGLSVERPFIFTIPKGLQGFLQREIC